MKRRRRKEEKIGKMAIATFFFPGELGCTVCTVWWCLASVDSWGGAQPTRFRQCVQHSKAPMLAQATLRGVRPLVGVRRHRADTGGAAAKAGSSEKVEMSDDEWRQILSEEQYYILRKKGTERPFTGEYDKFYPKAGYFACAGCGNPLYSAQAKFDSGCGWPAFDRCYQGGVTTEVDNSMGMRRVEIMCGKCGGHLGHVFEGEQFTETNERHCVNSLAVKYHEGSPDNASSENKVRLPPDIARPFLFPCAIPY